MSPESIFILVVLGLGTVATWILMGRASNVGDLSLWAKHFGDWTAERRARRLVDQVRREKRD